MNSNQVKTISEPFTKIGAYVIGYDNENVTRSLRYPSMTVFEDYANSVTSSENTYDRPKQKATRIMGEIIKNSENENWEFGSLDSSNYKDFLFK
ncbi:MAG: hypothetical protein ACD_22C00083G0007 [uncultured bacterium]|nr:MAG: hypothetical protein ACD_22C00083G0007 [uncultured bacterium]